MFRKFWPFKFKMFQTRNESFHGVNGSQTETISKCLGDYKTQRLRKNYRFKIENDRFIFLVLYVRQKRNIILLKILKNQFVVKIK